MSIIDRVDRDYLWVGIASAWSILMNATVFYFLVRSIGQTGFTEFVISRRIIALISVLIFSGTGVVLPRLLAIHGSSNTENISRLMATFAIVLTFFLAVTLVFKSFPQFVAGLIFAEVVSGNLLSRLVLFLLAIVVNGVLYAFFRGLLNFRASSALAFCMAVSIPLGLVFSDSASELFTFAGTLVLLVDATVIVYILTRNLSLFSSIFRMVPRHMETIFKKGITRVPGDFALEGMFALPLLVANHWFSANLGAYIGFGLVFVSLTNTVISPIGVILLPRTAKHIGTTSLTNAVPEMRKILKYTVVCASVLTIFLLFVKEPIIYNFLSLSDDVAVTTLAIVSLAIVPFSFYCSLRSFIDAADERALNSRNLSLSLLVTIFVIMIGFTIRPSDSIFLISAIPIGFAVLGTRSYQTYNMLLRRGIVDQANMRGGA